MPAPAPPPLTSIRPYLIRAWHEWMMDNGLTPHILVKLNETVSVPREYAQGGEIVLNINTEATGGLHLGNEVIRFQARFSGRVRDISVPVEQVASIFARENGQGMAFDVPAQDSGDGALEAEVEPTDKETLPPTDKKPEAARSSLSLVSKATPSENEADDGTENPPQLPDPSAPPKPPQGGGLKVVK